MIDKELSGKRRLKEALQLSDQAYLEKHPPIKDEIRHSERYLREMDRLSKRTRRPVHTLGKRASGMAAAILIVFGCSMSVDAVQTPVTEFFETISTAIYNELGALDFAPPHEEHDFSVLATDDPNKHYYRCKDKRCKEKYGEEFHTYVINQDKRRLECSVCGRIAK